MRMIYAFLALAQIRLAFAEHARAEMLGRHADEALVRARARRMTAAGLACRAGLPDRLNLH
ncbi:hypothetical protein MKK69_02850 [Methylobacterium sp. J-026]|uniref:hypothetical protein n=1 Tax=Methylobacterium sp. J-026 TaxID=2836624 RepID=UPI001FB917B3|nr:hypothetical protein [Methylobacterium sp. J-026]MCJ2133016.1 hypothetical protein [Methylobacterium sp. J-026]